MFFLIIRMVSVYAYIVKPFLVYYLQRLEFALILNCDSNGHHIEVDHNYSTCGR